MDALKLLVKKPYFGPLFSAVFFIFFFCLRAESLAARAYPLSELATTTIKLNQKTFKLWVMDTSAKRQEGMMYLEAKELPKNYGMLFVFPKPQSLAFWMKNTYIYLDLVFLDQDKKILNIERLVPHDLNPVPSKGLALYAIELSAGLAAKNKLFPGKHLHFSSSVQGKD